MKICLTDHTMNRLERWLRLLCSILESMGNHSCLQGSLKESESGSKRWDWQEERNAGGGQTI